MKNNSIKHLIRPHILTMKPYSSARSEFEGKAELMLDANENPYNSHINRYPDPLQMKLKNRMADWKNVSEEQIIIGNGSDEIIDLLIRLFCRPTIDKIRILNPSYGMYEVSAVLNEVELIHSVLDENFQLDSNILKTNWDPNEKLFFICSPNNPSGNTIDSSLINSIIENYSGIVVIDEAYIDFSDSASYISKINQYPNLFVMQTFSKSIGAAGLRVGYGMSSVEIISFLNKIKPPYNLSTIVQEEAIKQLDKINDLKEQIEEIKGERKMLFQVLSDLKIVEKVYDSEANFLLTKVNDASKIYNILKNKGIIVRNRNGQHHCDNCIRITVGNPAENKLLIQTLKSISNE